MNIIHTFKVWACATVAALSAAACTSSDDGAGAVPAGEKTNVTLQLALAPAAASPTLNNVWILQWDAAGNNKICRKERYHDTTQPLEVELEAGNDVYVAVIAGVDDGTVYQLGTPYADFCGKAYPNRIADDSQVPYSGVRQLTIDRQGQQIELPLKWIAAKISFSIASITPGYTIKSMQIKNIASPIRLLETGAEPDGFSSGDLLTNAAEMPVVCYASENLQGTEPGIASPQDRITTKKGTYLEIVATKEQNNIRTTATFSSFYGNNDTDNFDVARGNVYHQELHLDFDAENDKRLTKTDADASLDIQEPANCYMLAPTRSIPMAIPVSRVNDFWINVYGNNRYAIDDGKNDGAVKKWVAKTIWETDDDLVAITTAEGTDPNGYFILKPASGKVGSALIGLFDATQGNDIDPKTAKALWSWHIWVTDYAPGGGTDGPIPNVSGDPGRTAVPGGYVHHFTSLAANVPLDGGQAVIMDRDLGAKACNPSDLRASTGMYYQWGRKDPFYAVLPDDQEIPADGYATDESVPGATDHIISTKQPAPVSLAKAIQSPTVFFYMEGISQTDWLQPDNNNDNLWRDANNTTRKTIFDPCPPGWRVPGDTRTFESLIPREVWEPSWFDPANPGEGNTDYLGYYNRFPRQGVVCWDNSTEFFSNCSGRINAYNGRLFEYGSGQNLLLGTPISKTLVYAVWQHSLMGVNAMAGESIFESMWSLYRPSGCSVRCVKE